MKFHRTHSIRHVVCAAAMLAVSLATGQSWAGTSMEERIMRAPMPHAGLAGGPRIKVHYARVHIGGPETQLTRGLQSQAEVVKKTILGCAEARRRSGLPANPPREFPQFDTGVHKDTYVTANRQITYMRQYGFQMREDCSLEEYESNIATLESQAGSCEIDLVARTAQGECDPALHAAAPAPQHPPAGVTAQQQLATLRANPAMAAAAAQFERMAAGSGRGGTKRVLGIECEVLITPSASTCVALGGSFRPYSALELETGGAGQPLSKAVEARLDATLGAAIFSPHTAGGFRVTPREE